MKRMTALLLSILLLTACARRDDARAFSALYREAEAVTATAKVEVFSGDTVLSFTLDYRRAEGETTVTIQQPESLQGITAKLREGTGSAVFIDYQGVSVETLLPGIPGFSPMDALHGVLDDVALSLPDAEAPMPLDDIACLRLTFMGEGAAPALMKQVWLDRETGALRRAEFFVDGRMVMTFGIIALAVI